MKKQQPTPKKVPINRVKQIADSLKSQSEGKYQMARYLAKRDGTSNKKSAESVRSYSNSAINDQKKSEKLNTLVKKATALKAKSGGSLENIHTGSAKSHPGVLKAQSDKRKADSVILANKKKK